MAGREGEPATDERADPCKELGERERLRDVVVGPHVESPNPVADPVPSGEHQHRAPPSRLAQPPADLEPVEIGQHDVEDDHVIGVLGREPHRLASVTRDVDRVALLLEPALEEARHLRLVLHDEHAHQDRPAASAQARATRVRAG